MIIIDLDVSAAGVKSPLFLDQSIFSMIPPRVVSVIFNQRGRSPTNTNFRLTFLLTRLQEALYEDLAV